MSAIRVVIFDVGGVLTESPVDAIRDYAAARSIDYGILGPMLGDRDLAWSRWERNELDEPGFIAAFEAEAAERGVEVSGAAVMAIAFGAQAVLRPAMVAVVRHLHGRYRLGAITNNVLPAAGASILPAGLRLADLFEVVLESAALGIRKPDPRIFEMACDALGVTPAEAVFLDDIGANLKSARTLGMTTIKVDASLHAIDELERVLAIPLPRE